MFLSLFSTFRYYDLKLNGAKTSINVHIVVKTPSIWQGGRITRTASFATQTTTSVEHTNRHTVTHQRPQTAQRPFKSSFVFISPAGKRKKATWWETNFRCRAEEKKADLRQPLASALVVNLKSSILLRRSPPPLHVVPLWLPEYRCIQSIKVIHPDQNTITFW